MREELMFVRKISCAELLYNDMQDALHTYASQYVMEIKKLKNEKLLEDALNAAVLFNSGNNMRLVGRKFYDVDEPIRLKHFTIHEKDMWTSGFFNEKIDYEHESLLAYIVTHQKRKYFVLKVAHATMDGKGGMMLIENIFRFLSGQGMEHYDNALTDRELVKSVPHRAKYETKLPKLKLKNAQTIQRHIPRRCVIEMDGYTDAIIAKLAKVLAEEFKNDEARFMIPSDLRRHCRGEKHCGNLVLPTMLSFKQDDSIATINGKMLMSLKNKDELKKKNTSYFYYNYLPKFMRIDLIKTLTFYARKVSKFSLAGVISYLGKIRLEETKDFAISSFISLLPAGPLGPFILLVTEFQKKTYVALCYYEGQYAEEYIDNLCEKIRGVGDE